MAYCLNKTPCIDAVILHSCHKLPSSTVIGPQNSTFVYHNDQSDYWNIEDILAEEEKIPC